MNLPLDFHSDVRFEVQEAYNWYELRLTGLGRGFLNEVQRVLGRLSTNPAQYGFADADIREALLKGFPFAIYYRVLADKVRVLAVFHTSRDPSLWHSRN